MSQLVVKINGYPYTVGCEDGQEAHLQKMAQEVESRIESIKALGGPSSEGRLLVLAALLMADELHDTLVEMDRLRGLPSEAAMPAPLPKPNARLAKLARKAEDIAAGIEQS